MQWGERPQPHSPAGGPITEGVALPEDLKAPGNYCNVILSSVMRITGDILQREITAGERV